jgi:nucleoside-diphosphate-sugar epimerase
LLADPDITRVRSVARRPVPLSHPKLVHTQADLRSPAARDALAGVDVLWHLGFALWRSSLSSSGSGSDNLAAVDNVLAARPGRVVFASSAAVYGAWPDNPLPIGEGWVPRPNAECAYASEKLAGEERCLFGGGPAALVLRIGAVLGPHADRRVQKATRGYRLVVPAIRGADLALQFLDEDEVAAALLAAGKVSAVGVLNVAPSDWLTAADVARVAGSRVVRLPRRVLLDGSELAYRLRLLPFGADRSALINGPLALDAGQAASVLGWRASLSSADVLRAALGRP